MLLLRMTKLLITMGMLGAVLLFQHCPTQPEDDQDNGGPDTTSHNFTWTVDTLGRGGSYLRDVAIVDEDNIWVVGNIETDSGEYNAARWDGDQWHLMGIYSNTLDLYSIQYFAEDDIWVTDVCSPIHWDGQEWTLYHLQNMGLDACAGNAIWGSAPDDVYFVGSGGSIVHYDGSGFTQQVSGTEMKFLDIWGTSAENIWVCGRDEATGESVILYSDGSGWQTFYEWPPPNESDPDPIPDGDLRLMITSLWSDPHQPDTLVAVGGWGAFHVSASGTGTVRWSYPWRWDLGTGEPLGFPQRVRGSGANNIFVVGQRTSILHYNGRTWHNYLEWYDPTIAGVWFRSVAVTEDFAIMVGENRVIKAVP